MSCGVGRRRGSDLALLWLWCRPAATAPIQALAWEPPYAAGVALEKEKGKNEGYATEAPLCAQTAERLGLRPLAVTPVL